MKKNFSLNSIVYAKQSITRSLLSLLIFLTVVCTLHAQKMEVLPGTMTICPAKFEDMHTRVVPDDFSAKEFQTKLQTNATATFQVTYGPEAEANEEVKAAFQFALDIWANEIVSDVPIRIYAEFADLGAGVLASAGPQYIARNFPNAPKTDVFYPAALANSLAGEIISTSFEYELTINLGNGFDWYFGTDGNPGPGQFDFVTIALHEAGHGLGFVNLDSYSSLTGSGSIRTFGEITTFSELIINGDGELLSSFPDPSIELGDQLISGDLFINGSQTVEALGGEQPKLYAPNPYQGGSSISHWDEEAFPAGDINSLMTPSAGSAESIFDIGDITRGFFKDMGWVMNDLPITAIPTFISETILIDEIVTRTINLTNRSEADVNITASTTGDDSFVDFPDGTTYVIAINEDFELPIRINTTGLPKGENTETIVIDIEGSDQIEIPININVLDGTEAPIISVNPASFTENIEQFKTLARELIIENTGDADLTYSISIDDPNEDNNFTNRVKTTDYFIASNGFVNNIIDPATNSKSETAFLSTDASIVTQLTTSLYATDFENFSLGDIHLQNGWRSQFTDNWIVSDANPFEGSLHFRGVSDGLGGTRPASILAISPTVVPLDEPFMVVSAQVNIQGTGTSWEFIPQSPTQGTVVTRLRFNPDRSIEVLTEAGYVALDVTTPEGYFELKLVVDKETARMSILFDDQLVFSGQSISSIIEQVVFLSGMEETGSTIDVDNLEITDGDPDGSFLFVDPIAGVIPFGTSSNILVRFDTQNLDQGVYNATIHVKSNDTVNSLIDIPVSVTILQPPTIAVTPESFDLSIDVQTDLSPVKTETITISNSGEVPLDFSITEGGTSSTPNVDGITSVDISTLDMKNYGVGNTSNPDISIDTNVNIEAFKNNTAALIQTTSVITDSIAYDRGDTFPNGWVGLDRITAYTTAMSFDVDQDFTLRAIRNAFKTEEAVDPVIILEIYKGGSTPADGELLTSQAFSYTSPEGVLLLEKLEQPIDFVAGETFWVVHKYPSGIIQPQGLTSVPEGEVPRPFGYYVSTNGGTTWFRYSSLFDSVILCRALNGTGIDYIDTEPSAGSIPPGGSTDIVVTFSGEELPNGTYETDILVNSNDPSTPVSSVATTLKVSGQVSIITVSEEFLLFDNVFLGNQSEKTIRITNDGLETLTISNISLDNPDFAVSTENAVVLPGEFLDLVVTFSPTSLGSINGLLTINSDASNIETIDIVINGIGVDPPIARLDPLEKTETIPSGESMISEITLYNDGNFPLLYSFPEFAARVALAQPNVILNNTAYIDFNESVTQSDQEYQDTRSGNMVTAHIGTDSQYGYTWIDSDQPGGPVYNFVDITETGTEVTPSVSFSGNIEVDISFPFFFYGNQYEKVRINADGFLSFQESTGSVFINGQIPDDDGVNNIIAPFWDNFDPRQFGGAIHYQGYHDRFIVQWANMTESVVGSDAEKATFQLVLYPNGDIDVFYEDVEKASFTDKATVGIENADATDGAQVAFNTPYIKDQLALRFIAPEKLGFPFITDVDTYSGIVPAGGSIPLEVTLDASELLDGTYTDELIVSTNSPDTSKSTTQFELIVEGSAEIQLTPDNIQFEPLFIGLTATASFTIENTGTKTLEISSITNSNMDFIIDQEPISLYPGTSYEVTVTFVPSVPGEISDEIIITSNDSFGNESIRIPVTGIGISPPVIEAGPASISLILNEGGIASENLLIANSGDTELTYNIAYDTNPIIVTSPVPTQGIVPPGEKTEVPVEISAQGLELGNMYTGEINITSNDPITPEVTIPLSLTIQEISQVISFSLIDVLNNEIIGELTDGYTLDYDEYGHNRFNIIANTNEQEIGSVVFDYNNRNRYRVGNNPPYTLGYSSDNYFGFVIMPTGSNTLTATPYDGVNGRGDAGIPLTVNFEVLDSADATAQSDELILLKNAEVPSDQNLGASFVTVYPMPVENTTYFQIHLKNVAHLEARLVNLLGQVIYEPNDLPIDINGQGSIDMSDISQGSYVLIISDTKNKNTIKKKVLKL